jgi:hypothetical protein
MDMDMQHDKDTQHGFGHAAWIWTTNMHGCQNADKKISLASLVFCYFTTLSPASDSSIMVSPVPLVSD